MKIKPIKTEAEYYSALERLDKIFDARPNTPKGDEAEILSLLIDNYENTHYPIDAPDPIEAIKIRMAEMDLKQADFVPYVGSKSKISEVLNKKRKLTLDLIRVFESKLNLSASLLISKY